MMNMHDEGDAPDSQGMDLVPVLDSALSTPPVVYALTAKYQVPLDRLFTV